MTLDAGDFASALPALGGAVDLVISNPPYIPVGATVPPEVAEYDPAGALWGGEDGLDAVRVIEEAARRLLRPGGLVAVEHGAPQGAAVYWVFAEERGWRDTRNHKDLAGRDRFVTARLGTAGNDGGAPGDAGSGCQQSVERWAGMSARYDCTDAAQRAAGMAEAATSLRKGDLAVIPTDTVYGLAADAFSPPAVASLLAAKGRGRQMPPPVLVGTVRAATALVEDAELVRQGPHRRVLAGWPHPGDAGQPEPDLGPGGHQGHGRGPDAPA